MTIGNVGSPNNQAIQSNANPVGSESNIAPNSELGSVRASSTLATVGRVLLGIFTLGISEGIRALVNHFSARPAAEPRIDRNDQPRRDVGIKTKLDPKTTTNKLLDGYDIIDEDEGMNRDQEKPLTGVKKSKSKEPIIENDTLKQRISEIESKLGRGMTVGETQAFQSVEKTYNTRHKNLKTDMLKAFSAIDAFVEICKNPAIGNKMKSILMSQPNILAAVEQSGKTFAQFIFDPKWMNQSDIKELAQELKNGLNDGSWIASKLLAFSKLLETDVKTNLSAFNQETQNAIQELFYCAVAGTKSLPTLFQGGFDIDDYAAISEGIQNSKDDAKRSASKFYAMISEFD